MVACKALYHQPFNFLSDSFLCFLSVQLPSCWCFNSHFLWALELALLPGLTALLPVQPIFLLPSSLCSSVVFSVKPRLTAYLKLKYPSTFNPSDLPLSYCFNIIIFQHTIYDVCPESIWPCTIRKQRHLLKIQDTRNIVHRKMRLQSSSKQAP